MEFKYKLPVRYANLHEPIQMHGYTMLERTLNDTKLPGAKIWYTDMGLYIEYKDGHGIVPQPNVALVVLKDDAPKEPSLKRVK